MSSVSLFPQQYTDSLIYDAYMYADLLIILYKILLATELMQKDQEYEVVTT